MKKFTLVLLFAIILCAFLVTGCQTPSTSANLTHSSSGSFGEHINVPSKDFESRGLVFVETSYQVNSSTNSGSVNGETITYQALLKEAQRLGADAIINVVIDRRTETSSSGDRRTRIETWYGSALAIRYTTTIKGSTVSGNGIVSDIYYMNDGRYQTMGSDSGVQSPSQDQGKRSGGIFGRLFGGR